MPTISGSIIWNLPQADGTSNVREGFTDDQGNTYGSIDYNAPAGYDIQARLTADIAALQSQINDAQQAQQSLSAGNLAGVESFNGSLSTDAGATLCAQLVADLQNADDNAVNDSSIYSLMQQLDNALEAFTG
jgi:hypothetical protein